MSKCIRIIIFIVSLVLLGIVWFFTRNNILTLPDSVFVIIFASLIMLSFVILFLEHFFTRPTDVLASTIAILLLLVPLRQQLYKMGLWYDFFIYYNAVLFVASLAALLLVDSSKSTTSLQNRMSDYIKRFAVFFGRGRFLFFLLFIITLLSYVDTQSNTFLILFFYSTILLLIDPKKYILMHLRSDRHTSDIGKIFGVQSKKMFLAKLFEDRKSIRKFDIVEFRYSMQDVDDLKITGIVFDTYLLNQEKWAKILQLAQPQREDIRLEKNIVYKVNNAEKVKAIYAKLKIDEFVGVIIEGSLIGKVQFEYSKKKDDLQEGDLLELRVAGKRLFYQVIMGSTEKERLEERNETGFIEGEAVQLGEWQCDDVSFHKFGWVPAINTAIFMADTSDVPLESISYPYYKLGVIPGTTLPSVINLDDAVSHHMALLGITGSGKSFLALQIVEELKRDTKIICIDFTGEWKKRLETDRYKLLTKDTVEEFLANGNGKIGIFELPDLSNTTEVLRETQASLEKVFGYAKEQYDKNSPVKVALVLEEAHTITPETSYLSDMGDYGSNKALVNKMTQIALQGRKYGIGFLVIAQRTATVSKTVLTQCNTVICFQAFDETSFNFLGNYVGKDMVQALPNLKEYHAVVAGKAVKSNIPMIVDLRRDI